MKLDSLMSAFGYSKDNKGKTSGSRIKYFCKDRGAILIHNPHPQKELKMYQKKQIIEVLVQEELL